MTDQTPDTKTVIAGESLVDKLRREAAEKRASSLNLSNESQADVDALAKTPLKTPDVVITPEQEVERSYHVFYNTVASCKMLTDTGRVISFVEGKYVTDQQEEIDYLNKELGHPDNIYLSVVKGQEVMTSTELDPMAMLRKTHMAEFAALQAEAARKIAAGEPLSQSESEVQAMTPGSTADIAKLAAGSAVNS